MAVPAISRAMRAEARAALGKVNSRGASSAPGAASSGVMGETGFSAPPMPSISRSFSSAASSPGVAASLSDADGSLSSVLSCGMKSGM